MDKQNEQETAELKSLLEELRRQLLEASMHFDIWVGLYPTAQVVDVINRYKGFFLPTTKAHFDQFCVRISNIVSSDYRAPSLYKVFKILDANPSLAQNVDIRSLRKRLKQHRKVLEGIKFYRNTKGAHWDTGQVIKRKPVFYGESKRLLKELQEMFNEISGASTNNVWSFKVSQHGDTTALLNHLNELRTIHAQQTDVQT